MPWAVAQVGRAKLGQFVLVSTLVPPPCALWLSRGGDRDLALVPVVTFPHLAVGWEPSPGSYISFHVQPAGFFHPCQDSSTCPPSYQNTKQLLFIGCNSIDYGFPN